MSGACTVPIKRIAAALLSISLALSGCATSLGEDSSLLSPEEKAIRSVEVNRQLQATAIGCAIGALGGAVYARTTGERSSLYAIAGCGVGALSFAAAGAYMNAKTRSYGNEQQAYRNLIAAADEDIRETRQLNQTASRLVTQQRDKINRLNGQYRAGTLKADDYRKQIASAERNGSTLKSQIASLDEQIAYMREDERSLRRSQNTGPLNQRIRDLQAERDRLQGAVNRLATIYDDVPSEVARVSI